MVNYWKCSPQDEKTTMPSIFTFIYHYAGFSQCNKVRNHKDWEEPNNSALFTENMVIYIKI